MFVARESSGVTVLVSVSHSTGTATRGRTVPMEVTNGTAVSTVLMNQRALQVTAQRNNYVTK
jgi:hypothetical protein